MENIWVPSSIPKRQRKTHLSPQVHWTEMAPAFWLQDQRHPPALGIIPLLKHFSTSNLNSRAQQLPSPSCRSKGRRGGVAPQLPNGFSDPCGPPPTQGILGFFFAFQREDHWHSSLGSLSGPPWIPHTHFFHFFMWHSCMPSFKSLRLGISKLLVPNGKNSRLRAHSTV